MPKFNTKVLSVLQNPQTSHQPSSFFILSCLGADARGIGHDATADGAGLPNWLGSV